RKVFRPETVPELVNLGESTPMMTSCLPKRRASASSTGSMCTQLMQPGVKKSSSTARPLSSFQVSGSLTLYQDTDDGNDPGDACTPQAPSISASSRMHAAANGDLHVQFASLNMMF